MFLFFNLFLIIGDVCQFDCANVQMALLMVRSLNIISWIGKATDWAIRRHFSNVKTRTAAFINLLRLFAGNIFSGARISSLFKKQNTNGDPQRGSAGAFFAACLNEYL